MSDRSGFLNQSPWVSVSFGMKKIGCNGGYRGQGDCEWEGSFDTEDYGFLPPLFFLEGPLVIICSVFLHMKD